MSSVRIEVRELRSPALTGLSCCEYASPPHTLAQAAALLRLLLGHEVAPVAGCWTQPVAGGSRQITLLVGGSDG